MAVAERFNRYNESLEKLTKAMSQYSEASQVYAQASTNLMHSFSEFFETQLQDCACTVAITPSPFIGIDIPGVANSVYASNRPTGGRGLWERQVRVSLIALYT